MATRSVATVFGGSGFIGRYVVKRLAQRATSCGSRCATRRRRCSSSRWARWARSCRCTPRSPTRPRSHRAVQGADLVVNLVGILAERGAGDFQRVHVEGAGSGSRGWRPRPACARLVHMSAIGADPASPSRYGASKAAGEAAVRQAFPDGDDPAPVDRVRAGGPVLQPLRRDGADAARHAGDRRRRHGSSRSMSATSRTR